MKRYIKSDSDYDPDVAFGTDAYFRCRTAGTTTDPELLSIYAFDPNLNVRLDVGGNIHTPGYVLEDLYDGLDSWNNAAYKQTMLFKLLHHPNISAELLDKYADAEHWQYRKEVAMNKNTWPSTLDKLVDDTDAEVLWMVAGNNNTSSEALDKLVDRSNEFTAREFDKFIRWEVVKNPNVSVDTLRKLAEDPVDNIREKAIERLNTGT